MQHSDDEVETSQKKDESSTTWIDPTHQIHTTYYSKDDVSLNVDDLDSEDELANLEKESVEMMESIMSQFVPTAETQPNIYRLNHEVHERLLHDLSEKNYVLENKLIQYKNDTESKLYYLQNQLEKMRKSHLQLVRGVAFTAGIISSVIGLFMYQKSTSTK